MKKKTNEKKSKKTEIYGKIHFRISEPLIITVLTIFMTSTNTKQLPFRKVDPVTIPVTVTDSYDSSDTIVEDSGSFYVSDDTLLMLD